MTPSAKPSRVRRVVGPAAGLLIVSALALAPVISARAPGQETPGQGSARSVWDGVFTESQASRGRGLYAQHCASCHGAELQGGENRALAGERFWTTWQNTTVDRLLTHISTNMPFSDDGLLRGTLGTDVYVDITAHILRTNRFPAGAAELTPASAAGVGIVRKDGSAELPSGSFVQVVGCLGPRGTDRNWRLLRGSAPARLLDDKEVNLEAPLGDREYTLMFVLTSLDKLVGHRMLVRALLIGEGGVKGLNVTSIQSIGETCG